MSGQPPPAPGDPWFQQPQQPPYPGQYPQPGQGYPVPAVPQQGYSGYPPAASGPYSPLVGRPLVSDETTWSMLSHLSILALGIVGPIIIMSTKGNQSPYIRYHAVEALNMHITLAIVGLICLVTFFLIVPLLLLFAVQIAAIIYGVMGAMKANRGEVVRYPLIWRMVK